VRRMLLALLVAIGLTGWSLVGNLLLGETLYVVRNLVLTAGLLLLASRTGLWSWSGLDRSRWRDGARWGLLAALLVGLVVGLAATFGDELALVGALLADDRADLSRGELLYHALLRIPVGTAIFEEVAFRGVLLALLLRLTTTLRAVAWSSAVFGLWHVAPTIVALRVNDIAPASGEGLLAILGAVAVTAVAGAVFCWLRLASGSLLAPVLAHWSTNSFGLLAAAWTRGDA
jgi:uncharacterized protein